MCNQYHDKKYDKDFIDKLVHMFNWYNLQIQPRFQEPFAFVWDLNNGRLKGTLDTNGEAIDVSLTPDGSKALTCTKDIVTLWNLIDFSKIVDIPLDPSNKDPEYRYEFAVLSPDGTKFAVSFWRPKKGFFIRIYDQKGNPLGDEFKGGDYRLHWFSDNLRLLVSGPDELSVLDSTNGNVLATKYFPHNTPVTTACISPDDSKIAITGLIGWPPENGVVQVYAVTEPELSLKYSLTQGWWAQSVTFNNSGDKVIFGCWGFHTEEKFFCNEFPVVIWDYANSTIGDRLFSGHTNQVLALTRCRANDAYFFSSGKDGQVLLWNIKTGQVVIRLKGTGGVNWVDISADCKVGISGQMTAYYVTEQMVRRCLENDYQMITRRR